MFFFFNIFIHSSATKDGDFESTGCPKFSLSDMYKKKDIILFSTDGWKSHNLDTHGFVEFCGDIHMTAAEMF